MGNRLRTRLRAGGGGGLGPDLVNQPIGGSAGGTWAVGPGGVTRNGSATSQATVVVAGGIALVGTYEVSFTVAGFSGDSFGWRLGGGTSYGPVAANGTVTATVPGGGASGLTFFPWGGSAGEATIFPITVKRYG